MKGMETGTIVLVNTKQYPFNDSSATVCLQNERESRSYFVFTDVRDSDGAVGDVVVSGRAVNGFRVAFTGSAKRAEIGYFVTGGE
jgi:hypothetical protein